VRVYFLLLLFVADVLLLCRCAIRVAQLLEDNPGCHDEPLATTVPVSEYPWDNRFTPVADYCEELSQTSCLAEHPGRSQAVYGAPVFCYYEENVSEFWLH
jgi:hypothetical protein